MSEHLDNLDLLGDGGHVWLWEPLDQAAKLMTSTGTDGAARMVLANGPRRCRIAGRDGGPALLITTDESRQGADVLMTALEVQLEALARSGTPVAWEDDAGHAGDALVVIAYRRVGTRHYGPAGEGLVECWQQYYLELMDLSGADLQQAPPPEP